MTHLLGALVAAGCAPSLLARAGDRPRVRTAVAVWACSVVWLLTCSGMFHALPWGHAYRPLLQRMDHAAIFLIIAGGFTPVHTVLFRGVARWGVLGVVWGCAIIGALVKLLLFDAISEQVMLVAYAGLSGMGVVSAFILLWRLGPVRAAALILSLVAYGVGALFFVAGWPAGSVLGVGHHELWHLCVLMSIAGMWGFVRDEVLSPEEEAPSVSFWLETLEGLSPASPELTPTRFWTGP